MSRRKRALQQRRQPARSEKPRRRSGRWRIPAPTRRGPTRDLWLVGSSGPRRRTRDEAQEREGQAACEAQRHMVPRGSGALPTRDLRRRSRGARPRELYASVTAGEVSRGSTCARAGNRDPVADRRRRAAHRASGGTQLSGSRKRSTAGLARGGARTPFARLAWGARARGRPRLAGRAGGPSQR